ncbi:TetR/AcrR family transcriptional regulator C-terminal domain-containing protein [Nocardioides lianchengensis]|uniref:DNA-binding transcriptional regulator, AcrR family n=1 Tax=Nocardioides lianchengensis TaxID=1045774 RepID=A0A1G6NK37_9ACTN|nr:TetR/AcrR family transcriptional regulator C-terminal domain-containing protein [Nocardioides lianchengensis]NYG10794.1 AcrR family transcriptional regulator [Nocardioides lianchengensis]SDC68021.1 DNA-binding transcriptional regulator, AcrR family [Nocardioides lianchengensis]
MRNNRGDVVDRAIEVLDSYGLADLSMRRLGAELGVQPSALYHHFANKQLLLAAVADEVLARGARPPVDGPWDEQVVAVCSTLRDAVLAYRDGAELVATVHAFGLGARAPYDALVEALAAGDLPDGLPDDLVPVAARTLLHFVLGHVSDEQTHLQAGSAGAIADAPRESSDFALGLAIIVDGIRARVSGAAPA